MRRKKALITGIYGQDGSYIAELLKDEGYEVYGLVQNILSENATRIKKYLDKKDVIKLVYLVDLNSYEDVKKILIELKPDEIYHMAAFHVSSESKINISYEEMQLFNKNVNATLNILGICNEYLKNIKIVTAGSCLVFDNSETTMQNEETTMASNSLYGLAKITERNLVNYYRSKGLHASTVILYNHESSRRKDVFVTKKIVKNMIAIKQRKIKNFTLGSIDIEKDWGYAKDYVFAMYLMTKQNTASDYILSSGKTNSIRTFIEIVAKKLDISDWENYIILDDKIITRQNKTKLVGDCSLARNKLKWNHQNTNLDEIITIMIKNELNDNLE